MDLQISLIGMVKCTQKDIDMEVVIIGQNEAESIIKMYDSLMNYDYKVNWICDRCVDGSEDILKSLDQNVITTPIGLKGRQTSYSRNLGLSHVNKYSDVLFLDGDRYIVQGDLSELENNVYDIQLLLLENDPRIHFDIDDHYGNVFNCFYSCGIYIKSSAINKILDFQKGELFDESIQEHWGIEDTYLGDVCYHLGLTCNFNKNIILNGSFDKMYVDDLDVIDARFKKRDKLNVKWS